MLFSRRKDVTGALIAAIAEHRVCKEYLAVLTGQPKEKEGTLRDFLFRDASKNKTYVVNRMRKGVREASLSYRVLGEAAGMTLVRIRLHTGRTHQIRAQFSSRQLPLVGDGRYGGKDPRCGCALWAFHLSFTHPLTGAPGRVFSGTAGHIPLELFSAGSSLRRRRPLPVATVFCPSFYTKIALIFPHFVMCRILAFGIFFLYDGNVSIHKFFNAPEWNVFSQKE